MKPRQRTIDPVEAQQRLDANNGNGKKTAAEMGISLSGLRAATGRMTQRSRGKLHKDTPQEEVEAFATQLRKLRGKAAEIVMKRFESMTDEEIQRLKPGDLSQFMVQLGIATEKGQLVTGQATARVEVQDLASFLKNSTESGTGAAPAAAPAPIHVLRRDKAG